MLDGMKILAIVPARGGSKGVPRKNVRPVAGKPLIRWTLEAAKASACVDRIVVSSDDDEILSVAAAFDPSVPLRRPAELATDVAGSLDVVLHALDAVPGYELAILLQPTSPLRIAEDIDGCLTAMRGKSSCVSVCAAEESPYWMYRLEGDGKLSRLIEGGDAYARRQDLPAVYLLNGALYAFRSDWLRKTRAFVDKDTVGFVMPAERSIDIDTEADLLRAERALASR
jgi:N-acylneuraminate cytidylyltransferase